VNGSNQKPFTPNMAPDQPERQDATSTLS
jgi:hypothetical protein